MSKKSIKVLLLVEDNPGDARLFREMFNEQGSHNTEMTHVDCMSEAEKYLAERAVDIILLDLGLARRTGPGSGAAGACGRAPRSLGGVDGHRTTNRWRHKPCKKARKTI